MKTKRQFALNKLFNLFIIVGIAVFIVTFYYLEDISEIKDLLPLIALGLFIIGVPIIFMPYCYSFDGEGVTSHYIFMPKERYLWSNIYSIQVDYDDTGSANSTLFDLLFSKKFILKGDVEGKKRFYMQSEIQKSWRTKHLIEKYYDGAIDNCLFETKKSKNRIKLDKSYSTEEVTSMEREMKAMTKKCIAPFHNEIVQYDLELRKKYIYVTSDFIELNSRPLEAYTYTVLLEISRPGEKDEDKIWAISVDLIRVRLGRNAFKGVKNKNALCELEQTLTDTINSIRNNEIECLK